jgi:quinolinate synthase
VTHNKIKTSEVAKIKVLHPDALLLVHPECTPEVVAMADFTGSTKQIIDYANKSDSGKFVIGTEMGVLFRLRRDNPGKQFYLMSPGLMCPNMKKTSLESIYRSLNNMYYRIELDEEIRLKAKKSLDRMLEIE